MTKYFTQNILKFFLLIAITLSSGCGQSTVIDSPALTPAQSHIPTATATPSPADTPEPIHPKGILIYSDNNNTYALDLQNRKATNIISSGNTDNPYPVIDGDTIYFLQRPQTGTVEQPHQIFKVRLDGTGLEQLTFNNNRDKSELSGSPNSEYLTYVESGDISSIFLFDKYRRESRVIIQDSEFDFYRPSWSPDGKKIAFFKTTKDHPYGSGSIALPYGRLLLYSVIDEKIMDPIPEKESPIIEASWSPDGKNIVINVGDSLKSSIAILDVENGTVDQITEGKFYNAFGFDFEWSPDGKRVLFDGISHNELFLLELTRRKISTIPATQQRIAGFGGLWSRDGNHIAFITSAGKPPIPNPSILNIQNIDTGELIQFEIPGEGWISFVSWLIP